MRNIKSRFLNRYKTIPSLHAVSLLCCGSPDRLSSSQTIPNFKQQGHATKTSVTLRDEVDLISSKLYGTMQDGHMVSPCALETTSDTDVFEECVSELDTMLEMVSSSSSSSFSSSSSSTSSCCPSPPRVICNSNEIGVQPTTDFSKRLTDFEERCPPGGSDKVILYTTSLTGIRKTYEDCHAIKFLLESFRVVYFERDVSMHLEFRDEFWQVLGCRTIPPRLFINGRHIGGVDEVVSLHELGMLETLLKGATVLASSTDLKCRRCGGVRFLLCLECNGSCKIYIEGEASGRSMFRRCTKCNENGLIKCPNCSC